jgi:hypothetical protein
MEQLTVHGDRLVASQIDVACVGHKGRIANIEGYQVKKAEAIFDGVFDKVSVEEDIERRAECWFH